MTPWTGAFQAPLSKEFSRQEYWSGLPFPFSGDLPNLGIEPWSPTLQANSLSFEPSGKQRNIYLISLWELRYSHKESYSLLFLVPHTSVVTGKKVKWFWFQTDHNIDSFVHSCYLIIEQTSKRHDALLFSSVMYSSQWFLIIQKKSSFFPQSTRIKSEE